MQPIISTQLSIIMKMLCLSCSSLANSVHVDRTLVSRWKNGRIQLLPQSPHFQNVVQALARQNEELGQNTLEAFFMNTQGMPLCRGSEMEQTLHQWLADRAGFSPTPADSTTHTGSMYESQISVYSGQAGKRKAIGHWMEELFRMPDSQTVVVYDFDAKLLGAKDTLSAQFQKRLRRLAAKKCRWKFIVFLDDQQDELHHLYKLLLPIIGLADTTVHYVYRPTSKVFDYVYYVDGKMMLMGKSAHGAISSYTGIVRDHLTVEALAGHIAPLLEQAHPLVTQMVDEPLHKVLSTKQVRDLVQAPHDQYVIGEDIGLLAESCLDDEQVMLDLNLTAQEANVARKYTGHKNQNLNKLLYENGHTFIVLDLKRLTELKQNDKVEIPALTALLGRKVCVSSRGILRRLRLFWRSLSGHVELAFRPEETAPFCEDVNVWIKENALLCFHQNRKPGTRIMIQEFSTVNWYFERAHDYWQGIPQAAKQKEYIDRQFELLLS